MLVILDPPEPGHRLRAVHIGITRGERAEGGEFPLGLQLHLVAEDHRKVVARHVSACGHEMVVGGKTDGGDGEVVQTGIGVLFVVIRADRKQHTHTLVQSDILLQLRIHQLTIAVVQAQAILWLLLHSALQHLSS